MKRLITVAVVVMSVLSSAIVASAQYKFTVKGKVTAVKANQVTVTDDAGQVIVVEGDSSGIKLGDRVLFVEGKPVTNVRTQLTPAELAFLKDQCKIDEADANVIPQLSSARRQSLFAKIEKRDCQLLGGFKASRTYYHSLDYGKAIPLAPAGWSIDDLTQAEFKRYTDILEKAPW